MANQKLVAGAGADDATVGSIVWTNPGNITAKDGVYATNALVLVNDTSHYIKGSTYGFTIPTGATINGILPVWTVSIAALGGTVNTNSAKVGKGGVINGAEKNDSAIWTTTDTDLNYGSATDLHGLTWAPADINAANFLTVLSCILTLTPASTARVDAVTTTVYYQPDVSALGIASMTASCEAASAMQIPRGDYIAYYNKNGPVYAQTRTAAFLVRCKT